MYNMLLEETGSFSKYILLIILVAMLVLMFVWNFLRQKKAAQQEEYLQSQMVVGTKVKTYAGVYGTIVGIYETTDGKVARLSLDGKTIMEIDFRSIYAIDEKTEIKEETVIEEANTASEEPVAVEKEEKKPASKKTKKSE